MSAFFCKKLAFFVQKSTFTQSNSIRAVLRDFLVLFSVFARQKVIITENITFADSVSGIQIGLLQIGQKIWKMTMTSHFSDMTSWSIFFDVVLFLLSSLGTTQSSMSISSSLTIFFYKGLTRNPEIRNTLVWLLPNIWRLRWVMDTKFGMNVSNRMLLNAAKCQGYSFYRFWVIKGKPTWRGGGW